MEHIMTDSHPIASADDVARKGILAGTVANFMVGTAAGLAAVFLPRMMLLLSVDTELAPERYISVFHADFVMLGLAFALTVGIICAIIEFGARQEPKAIFMTALGIPALLSGVLNTTSATNKLQKVEQQKVTILRGVSDETGIARERVQTWEVIGNSSSAPERGRQSSGLGPSFTIVSRAFAQAPHAAEQLSRFDAGIQIQRPSYVLVLKRASSQDEAVRLAKSLQKDVPTAQAIKTDQGFFVVDSVTPRPEADALLQAIQLKSKRNLNPSLLQVPK